MGKKQSVELQLTFLDNLLKADSRDEQFIKELTTQFQNLKWLRMCVRYSVMNEKAKEEVLPKLDAMLIKITTLMFQCSRYIKAYKGQTLLDFNKLVLDKDYLSMDHCKDYEFLTSAFERSQVRLKGLFLGFKDSLKGSQTISKEILQDLKLATNIIFYYNAISRREG